MITSMINQKRGLTNTTSCLAIESPGRHSTSLKIWSKRRSPVEPRWTKQQTRSSGPNQLKRIALSRGHHRVRRPTHRRAIKECSIVINHAKHADCRITFKFSLSLNGINTTSIRARGNNNIRKLNRSPSTSVLVCATKRPVYCCWS